MHVYLYVEIRYCLGLHALLYSMKFLFHSKVDSLAWSSRCGVLSDGKRLEKTKDWQKSAVWSVPVVDMEHGSCCQKHLVHAMLRSQDSRDPPQAVLGIQYVTVHMLITDDHR